MDRDQIIEKYPILTWVQDKGAKLRRSGRTFATNLCPNTEHGEQHLCVSLDPSKELWHCNDCDVGGTVIDWVMHENSLDTKQAMTELGGDASSVATKSTSTAPSPKVQPSGEGTEVCAYTYTDETGRMLYQVVRYEPKTFRQRQPKGEAWQWNLDGVTRVLYNLPRVLVASSVVVTEGEKDADTLNELGMTATTNAGGSGAWLDAYADTLKGKDAVIFPDNDQPGEKWFQAVLYSLHEKANSVKRVAVPQEFKDVSEWLAAIPEGDRLNKLTEVIQLTPHAVEPIPIYSVYERAASYREFVRNTTMSTFSMESLSPKFSQLIDPMSPGEVVMFVGDTGAGKTAVFQHIARNASPLKVLLFELELPLTKMHAREMQQESGCFERDVKSDYRKYDECFMDKLKNLDHVFICPESGLDMRQIEKYITRSELKIGQHPGLVMIDYMSLVRKDLKNGRYEAIANAAEQAKVIAKRSNVVMMVGSQVSRPKDSQGIVKKIELHSARGAGELENSCNLMIGITRPNKDRLRLEVIKATSGEVGGTVDLGFDGPTLRITDL